MVGNTFLALTLCFYPAVDSPEVILCLGCLCLVRGEVILSCGTGLIDTWCVGEEYSLTHRFFLVGLVRLLRPQDIARHNRLACIGEAHEGLVQCVAFDCVRLWGRPGDVPSWGRVALVARFSVSVVM